MAWDVISGVTKMARDVMSWVTKTAWDVLSGVANLCGMFCPGCKKMAWDVLSRDVLSGSPLRQMVALMKVESIAERSLGYGCTTIRRKPFRRYDNWSHTTFGRCDSSPSTTFGRKT